MLLNPTNFESQVKLSTNPRRLEEGVFIEFNYKKRDDTSEQYDAIVLDVYPPGGYVWALKLNDMPREDIKRILNKVDVVISEKKGIEIQRLEVPENGLQSYQMVKKLKLEQYYRKFIMKEMTLVRVRPLDYNSLV
jgi:hypothetical protein